MAWITGLGNAVIHMSNAIHPAHSVDFYMYEFLIHFKLLADLHLSLSLCIMLVSRFDTLERVMAVYRRRVKCTRMKCTKMKAKAWGKMFTGGSVPRLLHYVNPKEGQTFKTL